MPTIGQVIERLMPRGTDYRNADEQVEHKTAPDWTSPPIWPPDMFGVVATLVRLSECYTHCSVRGGGPLGESHTATTRRRGREWARSPRHPACYAWVFKQWTAIRKSWGHNVGNCRNGSRLAPWAIAALRLLAAADEASAGVGFGKATWVARVARVASHRNDSCSVTILVDVNECAVQPKGRTPPVGCNLRSMSMHLALLPPTTVVRALHLDPTSPVNYRKQLGVLLVPYPYLISDADLRGRPVQGQRWGHLSVRCSWGRTPIPSELARFVVGLVRAARVARRRTDVVILPELALSAEQLRALWVYLQKIGIRLLVTGVHEVEGRSRPSRNVAVGCLAGKGRDDYLQWRQSKHHRWRVDDWQIKNYGLPLDPARLWWEDIDVDTRTVVATRFTDGGTLACLVCEGWGSSAEHREGVAGC
jgi:hypothetical protein